MERHHAGMAGTVAATYLRGMALFHGPTTRLGMVDAAIGGKGAVEGWTETSEITALDLARRCEDCGVAAIIYTDISRDGTMQGPNIEATVELAGAVNVPVIASGGVSSLADLEALKKAGEGTLEGVISGRALYDGRINVTEAVKLLAETC